MKRLIACITLGTLLVGGLLVAQNNNPADTAMELEPTILSVPNFLEF